MHYTWKKNPKPYHWAPRQRGRGTIGRMPFVSPRDSERFALRLLLHKVPGPQGYEDLRIVDGHHYPTFVDAAKARGLLDNDDEYDYCLQEAIGHMTSASQLRQLFVTILIFGMPSHPGLLWEQHSSSLCDDYQWHYIANNIDVDMDRCIAESLRDIHSLLAQHNWGLDDFYGMPSLPDTSIFDQPLPPLSHEQDSVPSSTAVITVHDWAERVADLNTEQRDIFDTIINAVRHDGVQQRIFFIDGPGGSGKTFLYNTLLAYVRTELGQSSIAVASTGVAALLLLDGATAHSMFRIPIDGLNETSTCPISVQTNRAQQIRKAALIVWDEAPMMNRLAVEAVDRTLRDIMSRNNPSLLNIPFGGKVVVFGGDFRQTLPVIEHGNRAQTVAASLSRSYIWQHVQRCRLTSNMRLQNSDHHTQHAQRQRHFAQYLLDIGEGRVPTSKLLTLSLNTSYSLYISLRVSPFSFSRLRLYHA